MSSDINVDNILESAEKEIVNIKDNVANLELKFQFMQQDIAAIREAVTMIIYKKQINNETHNKDYIEEKEISVIIDEEDEVAEAEQRLKFQSAHTQTVSHTMYHTTQKRIHSQCHTCIMIHTLCHKHTYRHTVVRITLFYHILYK